MIMLKEYKKISEAIIKKIKETSDEPRTYSDTMSYWDGYSQWIKDVMRAIEYLWKTLEEIEYYWLD